MLQQNLFSAQQPQDSGAFFRSASNGFQILRSQIPVGFDNLITAGRMIDADAGAFGALRVMVNMNQSGEAAARLVLRAMKTGTTLPSAAASEKL